MALRLTKLAKMVYRLRGSAALKFTTSRMVRVEKRSGGMSTASVMYTVLPAHALMPGASADAELSWPMNTFLSKMKRP